MRIWQALCYSGCHARARRNSGNEFIEARDGQIWSSFGRAFPRKTEPSIGTIDPHALQAELVGWHYIGAQALPHMENPLTWNTECGKVFNSGVKMRPVRLVSADALGGDDEVEAERELAARAFQRRIVDVAKRTNLHASLECRQSLVAVCIGRPLMGRCGENLLVPLVDGDTELDGDPIKASAQDLGIKGRWAFLLDFGGSAVKRLEEVLVRSRHAIPIGPAAEKRHDGRLPIDEGSVHVKGHGVEIGKLEAHGFLWLIGLTDER